MLNRYIRAISANYVFWVVNTLFFLIITPIAIKVMGPEFYGLWAILNAILIFSSVGTLGMGMVVNKFGAEEGENSLNRDAIFSTGVAIMLPMATLIAGIILIFRNWISNQLVSDPALQVQMCLGIYLLIPAKYPRSP